MADGVQLAAVTAAAENGDPEAMYTLARYHQLGKHGAAKDMAASLVWLEKAAEADHPAALNLLGGYFRTGEAGHVPCDLARALALFRRGAALDNAAAQFNLAVMLQVRALGDLFVVCRLQTIDR